MPFYFDALQACGPSRAAVLAKGCAIGGLRWHGLVLLAAAIAALTWPGYDRFFQHSLQTNIDPDLRVPAGGSSEAFGIAWYLLQLAGNSLLPRLDPANDRHLYLALPGVALVLVVPLLSMR